MFHTKITYEALSAIPSTYTDPKLLKELAGCVCEIDEQIKYITNYKTAPSDDFAFISQKVPAVYFMLGSNVEGNTYPQHNSKVLFNEECMPYGAAIYACCAFKWLKNNK